VVPRSSAVREQATITAATAIPQPLRQAPSVVGSTPARGAGLSTIHVRRTRVLQLSRRAVRESADGGPASPILAAPRRGGVTTHFALSRCSSSPVAGASRAPFRRPPANDAPPGHQWHDSSTTSTPNRRIATTGSPQIPRRFIKCDISWHCRALHHPDSHTPRPLVIMPMPNQGERIAEANRKLRKSDITASPNGLTAFKNPPPNKTHQEKLILDRIMICSTR
jgi:hypothetical protein